MNKKVKYLSKPILFISMGFFVFTPNHSFSKSKIKELTSNETAKKAAVTPRPSRKISSGQKVHAIGIGLGQTFLHGEFADNGDDKITPDLFYTYRASHSFDFFANIHYSEHKVKSRKAILSGLALGIKAKMYQIDAFSPFLLGGLGFYRPVLHREVDNKIVKTKSKITFGVHLGAGAELKLNNRVAVGVLGQYHNPFDVQQEDQSNEVEGSYFKLLITGLYYF